MLRWLILFMLLAAPVRAQEATTQPALPESTMLEHRAVKGIWFPMAQARQLLQTAKELRKIQVVVDKTQARLNNAKERSALLTKQVGTADEIARTWRDTAKQQAAAMTREGSVWRSPYLWVTVGFLVGAATTVGIAVAVKNSGAVN